MVKKRRKKSKNYFTQDTEDAIVLYNNTECSKMRSDIYAKHIHYPYFKLTENIIHTFKFYHTEVSNLEHLQHEIITFLLSKIHLFDPTRGAKAYSYFGTIADAILELFRKRETIEVFNKKALYIYIREMVDVKTPKITKIADKLHDIFKSQYVFFLENGWCKF